MLVRNIFSFSHNVFHSSITKCKFLSHSLLSANWLVVWCLTLFSTVVKLYHSGKCTFPCFPWVFLTHILHNMLSKPLASFPGNHCWNNGHRWERNESCCNDYHQSSERILAEPGIEPGTSCSEVRKATKWVTGLSLFSANALNLNQSEIWCLVKS